MKRKAEYDNTQHSNKKQKIDFIYPQCAANFFTQLPKELFSKLVQDYLDLSSYHSLLLTFKDFTKIFTREKEEQFLKEQPITTLETVYITKFDKGRPSVSIISPKGNKETYQKKLDKIDYLWWKYIHGCDEWEDSEIIEHYTTVSIETLPNGVWHGNYRFFNLELSVIPRCEITFSKYYKGKLVSKVVGVTKILDPEKGPQKSMLVYSTNVSILKNIEDSNLKEVIFNSLCDEELSVNRGMCVSNYK